MRRKPTTLLPLALTLGSLLASAARAQNRDFPALPAGELVRQAVDRELKASATRPNFLFRTRKQTLHGVTTRAYVPTAQAMIGRTLAYNDHPLGGQYLSDEDARLNRFLTDPAELRAKQKQEKDDADRVTRVIRALPEAFLYEYDGFERSHAGVGSGTSELVRLKLRPNPKYDPPSRLEQILTGMEGTALIDVKHMRVARMEGTLQYDVSFGWVLFGHLDKGGRIVIEQNEVADNTWAITRLALVFSGRVLFFKSINVNTEEVSQGFTPVPAGLSLADGLALLKKQAEVFAAEAGPAQNR
jgi:hypothetical protein